MSPVYIKYVSVSIKKKHLKYSNYKSVQKNKLL